MNKKLSLEELDKLMLRDLKRAYNEGIDVCIEEALKVNLDFDGSGDYDSGAWNAIEMVVDKLKKLKLK